MAFRLAPRRITVNAVAPGPFESQMMAATLREQGDAIRAMVPRGRIGTPEDMAGVAIYLSSRAGAYVTGATIPAVKTSQIYKGSISFLFLQVIVLASIITFPQLVVSGISKGPQIDADAALEAFRLPGPGKLAPVPSFGFPAPGASAPEGGAAAPAEPGAAADDPMKAILEAVQKEAEAKK